MRATVVRKINKLAYKLAKGFESETGFVERTIRKFPFMKDGKKINKLWGQRVNRGYRAIRHGLKKEYMAGRLAL